MYATNRWSEPELPLSLVFSTLLDRELADYGEGSFSTLRIHFVHVLYTHPSKVPFLSFLPSLRISNLLVFIKWLIVQRIQQK